MAARGCLFLMVLLSAIRIERDSRPLLIAWNVGQGQWVSLVDGRFCWHFDTGGENAPWTGLIHHCRDKQNILTYSHWDWDHVSFASQARHRLPDLCVLLPPEGPTSERKKRLISAIPRCRMTTPPYESWINASARTANAKSRVVWWRGILIPGDSPAAEEKRWVQAFPHLADSRLLVLGHHGSQSSTSRRLLIHAAKIRMAIASARRQRYGHPHPRVERDLRDFRIPLLTTESWGTIAIEL